MSFKTDNAGANAKRGNALRLGANTKGTGSKSKPAAMALKGRGRKLAASANPDGRANRP